MNYRENMTESKFEELLKLNVNDKVERKKSGNTELTYLSWAFAVSEIEKAYPEWEYSVLEFNGLPYQFDPNTGYLVWTEIKAGGKTKRMWLPVMDGSNKAMKNVVQEYFVKGWNGAPPTKKTVEAATMFDINKTIMRCLVKNIAMFGIGLYIYAGEDLPESDSPLDNPTVMEALGAKRNAFGLKAGTALTDGSAMQETQEEENKKQFARIKDLIENVGSSAELQGIWFDNAKQINSLKKYATALYDLLVEAKDTMKAQFIGE